MNWRKSVTIPHRHAWEWRAFTARPEGGTYYQQCCTRCPRKKVDQRFAPTPILAPSAMFTIKIRRELLPVLHERARNRSMNSTDFVAALVREALLNPE